MTPAALRAKKRARIRRALLAVLICALSLVIAGCGGCGDDDKDKENAKAPAPAAGLVAKGDSAAEGGEVENYVPEGELVADSGFRPDVNGFSFENYGNDVEPENMTPAEMYNLFGDQVCLAGEGADCQLIPAAQEWMDNQNEGMAGGHCQGFSVLALRMYNEDIAPTDFGGESPFDLDVQGNVALQQSIAQHFTYQFLPPVIEQRVKGTPTDIVNKLIEDLPEDGDEIYTLGVYKRDFTAGHAITPYAVEDKGDGLYAILVYDNNFPGTTRAVEVDANEDTWKYVSGTNPDDLGQVYEGDATTNTLELDPTFPGAEVQPCYFCEEGTAVDEGKGSKGSAGAGEYTEVTLGGDPENHPHLVFTDDDGNRTGIVGGKMLQEIPDIEVVKTYAVQNWKGAPEPRFRLPAGAEYQITVDGTDLEKTAQVDLDIVGNGLFVEIDEIKLEPGQKDEMFMPGGYGITYQSNGKEGIAPNIFAGLEEDDAAYNMAASAVGLKPGSTISLLVDQDEKVVILDSTGAEGEGDVNPVFILQLTRADAEGNISQWQNAELELDGPAEQKVGFEYSESPEDGKPIDVVLFDKDVEPIDTLELAPQKVEQTP
jgi:hypothetical protein